MAWLRLLRPRIGACLADDMGLGKDHPGARPAIGAGEGEPDEKPSLLVAPASLLANWAAGVDRFAPSLTALISPSAMTPAQIKQLTVDDLAPTDLVITSYGSLLRVPILSQARLALCGAGRSASNRRTQMPSKPRRPKSATPRRRRISADRHPGRKPSAGDLWSIFDFINPGLLGTAKQFTSYTRSLAAREHNPYGPFRELVRPYILRRMKTDKTWLSPTCRTRREITARCNLQP